MAENWAEHWKAYEKAVAVIAEATAAKDKALEALRASLPPELLSTLAEQNGKGKATGKKGPSLFVSKEDKETIAGLIVPTLKKHAKGMTGPDLEEEVRKQAGGIKFNTSHFEQQRNKLLTDKKIRTEGNARAMLWFAK